jgi:hypothetical protein
MEIGVKAKIHPRLFISVDDYFCNSTSIRDSECFHTHLSNAKAFRNKSSEIEH